MNNDKTYSKADYQIELLAKFKNELIKGLEKCDNLNSALNFRDDLINRFDNVCASNILKNFMYNTSEELINAKFKL